VARDTKGLYAKALAGEIPQFTGVSDPYEPPTSPELALDTSRMTVDEAVDAVRRALTERGYLDSNESTETEASTWQQ
jgi:adenylylsulfate kinase-like enzyme